MGWFKNKNKSKSCKSLQEVSSKLDKMDEKLSFMDKKLTELLSKNIVVVKNTKG